MPSSPEFMLTPSPCPTPSPPPDGEYPPEAFENLPDAEDKPPLTDSKTLFFPESTSARDRK